MAKACLSFCFFIAAFFVAVCLNSSPVSALTVTSGITVNPSVKDITISPDQSQVTFPLRIINNTQTEITLELSVVDFGALNESGGVAFLGEESNLERKYGLAAWSSLDVSSLTLKPKQSKEINVTLINRPSLALGGHYGAVLFKLAALPSSDPQKVKFNQVFSSLILAKKAGGDKYDLQLNKAKRTNNTYSLPEAIKLRFYNGGNVHVAPGGSIRLVDPIGRVVASGPINPEVGRILPEEFRVFSVALKPAKVAWMPGRYQLIIKYNFDERNSFATYTSTFVFINGLGVALLIGLCLLAIFMIWQRKKVKKFFNKIHPYHLTKSRK